MKTIRTISNISYNTPEHFEKVVGSLVDRGVIDWCYWICHKADVDELKDHIHLVLKPASRVDTVQLKRAFDEFDPNMPDKPLSVTSKWQFTTSMDDWLLYGVHDQRYLASKGQSRNVRYTYEDLRSTDMDALRADWSNIDFLKFDRITQVLLAVEQNRSFVDLVRAGVIPVAQMTQWEHYYSMEHQEKIKRDGGRRTSHEVPAAASDGQNNVDEDGVILEPVNADGDGVLQAEQGTMFDGFVPDETIQF